MIRHETIYLPSRTIRVEKRVRSPRPGATPIKAPRESEVTCVEEENWFAVAWRKLGLGRAA